MLFDECPNWAATRSLSLGISEQQWIYIPETHMMNERDSSTGGQKKLKWHKWTIAEMLKSIAFRDG